jgi:signal transduction histidine kinase
VKEEPSVRDPLGLTENPANVLAVLAHELRGPLASIRSAVQVLRLGANDLETRAFAEGVLERQSKHMSQMIEDLVEAPFTRTGQQPLRREWINIANVVDASVETVHVMAMERGQRIEMSAPPEPIFLYADPTRLQQTVTNLLTNAVKFTPPGGRVSVTIRREGDEMVLKVRDTGEGIEPEMLDRVFEPYWRAPRARNEITSGLGIGLALVRYYVELHGGSVTASSVGLGHGAEFQVRLDMNGQA